MFLRAFRWRIIIRSHPLRASVGAGLIVCGTVCSLAWRYLLKEIPIWLSLVSHPIFQAAQAHPTLGRFIRVLINAVPDIAFALLAVAGLAYLVPDTVRNLEKKRGVRLFLIAFFTLFGLFAIIVNAVNREDQEHKEGLQEERMGVVTKSVTNIQEALRPKVTSMTESERREHLTSALRDEYIITQNPIDPEIVSGAKMPPEAWVNRRLQQMGEKWTVKEQLDHAASQVVQQIAPEEKKARVVFSFFQRDWGGNPSTVKLDPMNDGKFSVSIAAVVVGDTPAQDLQIWIRECLTCEWDSPPPPGFLPSDQDHQFDRQVAFSELLPNVATPRWDFTIKVPTFPKYDSAAIGCYYACKNCAPVDWKKPQVLWVTRTVSGLGRLSPPIAYTPEPARK